MTSYQHRHRNMDDGGYYGGYNDVTRSQHQYDYASSSGDGFGGGYNNSSHQASTSYGYHGEHLSSTASYYSHHASASSHQGDYQQPHDSSTGHYQEDDSTMGMVGIGARRLAQKQQARRERERKEEEQRRQEQYAFEEQERQRRQYEEDLERQRRYEYAQEEERRRRHYQEEEERRIYDEQRQHEREEERRRQEWYEHDQRMQQQEKYEADRRQRDTEPQDYFSDHRQGLESAYSHREEESKPQSRNGARSHIDSQATARPHHYGASLRPDGMGGLQASFDTTNSMYQDDYEEASAPPSRSHSPAPVPPQSRSSMDRRMVVRETVFEPLPKATCADCGDKLPFEDLVGHVCIRNACQSPLLLKGAGSIPHQARSTKTDLDTLPANSDSRTGGRPHFFDHYEQRREGTNNATLFPSPHSGERYPSPQSDQLDNFSKPSPALSSRSLRADAPSSSESEADERIRRERKQQIEAQRAAKQIASRNAQSKEADVVQSASHTSSKDKLFEKESLRRDFAPAANPRGLHRRAPESNSSSSTASSKSSASSLFLRSRSNTMTPSSSAEHVSNVSLMTPLEEMPKAPKSSPRTPLDLHDIEGLVRDIENAPPTPPRKERTHRQRPKLQQRSATTETPHIQHPVLSQRRPSDTSVSSCDSGRRSSGSSDRHRRPMNAPKPPQARPRADSGRKVPKTKLCNVCLKAFGRDQPMIEKDGKVFCMDDYADLYLEKCRKCQQAVRTVGVRSRDGALTGLFHRECFSCLRCDAHFADGTFYVYENAPYCSQHYHTLNGTLCSGCNHGIEGQCRQLSETGERFHPHCLTCQFDDGKEFCKDLLHDYYIRDGRRLCEWHFGKVVQAKAQQRQRSGAGATATEERSRKGHRAEMTDRDLKEMTAAEKKKAKRTTYLRTVAAKKGRA